MSSHTITLPTMAPPALSRSARSSGPVPRAAASGRERRARRLLITTVLVLIALVTATGAMLSKVTPAILQPGHVNTFELEHEIAGWMGSRSPHSFTVSCPTDRSLAGRPAVFTCEATGVADLAWKVEVTVGKGNSLSWRLAERRADPRSSARIE